MIDIDTQTVRDRKDGGRLQCPHCRKDDSKIFGYGNTKKGSGRRRYLCLACRKHFNDHTGTLLHNTKRLDRWPAFIKALLDGKSVRQIAKDIGVSPTTAQSWRKKLLVRLVEHQDWDQLVHKRSVVECTEVSIKRSRKGQQLNSAPNPSQRESIVFCRNRHGHVYVGCQLEERLKKLDQEQHIVLLYAPSVSDSVSLSPPVESLSLTERRRLHTDRISDISADFSRSYARMRGTATAYLPLYAAWHQFLHEHPYTSYKDRIRKLLLAGI